MHQQPTVAWLVSGEMHHKTLVEAAMATILIVDDDQAIVRLLSRLLESEHFDVMEAHSGGEALTILEDRRLPDLMVLDIHMPDMTGKEVFRAARLAGYNGPIIMCSAYGATDVSRELGAQDAIDKPFEPDLLVAKVRDQLGG